ncbi:MAG: DNA double-strand break repair nuclease NurA [Blastocatellia bacterium]|nr:DNA double-strand break repair nuclease NurA [Blastocatellia bacterium]
MTFRQKLEEELRASAEDFRSHVEQRDATLQAAFAAAEQLAAMGAAEIARLIERAGNAAAAPAGEMAKIGLVTTFATRWRNHEEARGWAAEVLNRRTTFAADGSQIYAEKTTSIPIAMIRAGWFENPHDPTAGYTKQSSIEILTPGDLFREQEEPMNPNIRVDERRYLAEVAAVGEFLRRKEGWRERGERMPLAFLDAPLLVPFSQKGLQRSSLDSTVRLVALSRESKVPMVGYVDRSFSRDLMSLFAAVPGCEAVRNESLFDAAILNTPSAGAAALLSGWGSRTCFFYSTRRGLEVFIDEATGVSEVGFVYLQTTADSAPARIDVPAWIYDAGMLDEVVDVIRGECVVGVGYPYALEAADQAAVVGGRERELFFRALQEFANREKLGFSVSRKDESKKRRR